MDWADTIARRILYEGADTIRIEALKADPDPELAGLAAKMDREEVYHRLHAEMWAERLRDEPRFRTAVDWLWGQALGLLDGELAAVFAERVRPSSAGSPRRLRRRRETAIPDAFRELWDEMTMVRRSLPGASW